MTFTYLAPRQNALNLIMNVRKPLDEHVKAIKELLLNKDGLEMTIGGLLKVGTVHNLRYVLFDNDTKFATMTTFDGDFDGYVRDFTTILYPVLNPFYAHMEGTEDMLPVQKNPEKFLEFVKKYHVPSLVWFSAYPTATALEIREHFDGDGEK